MDYPMSQQSPYSQYDSDDGRTSLYYDDTGKKKTVMDRLGPPVNNDSVSAERLNARDNFSQDYGDHEKDLSLHYYGRDEPLLDHRRDKFSFGRGKNRSSNRGRPFSHRRKMCLHDGNKDKTSRDVASHNRIRDVSHDQDRNKSSYGNRGKSAHRRNYSRNLSSHGKDASTRDCGRDVTSRNRGRDVASRDRGRDVASRDRGRDVTSRDRGRDVTSRDRDRDVSSRDRGRDVTSRDRGRDVTSRDRGRDVTSRDRGRDVSSRDRGRDVTSRDRGRDVSSRNRGRDVTSRDRSRDVKSRDRGRDATSHDRGRVVSSHDRDRDVSSRYCGRDALSRDLGRDALSHDRGRDMSCDRDRRRNRSSVDRGNSPLEQSTHSLRIQERESSVHSRGRNHSMHHSMGKTTMYDQHDFSSPENVNCNEDYLSHPDRSTTFDRYAGGDNRYEEDRYRDEDDGIAMPLDQDERGDAHKYDDIYHGDERPNVQIFGNTSLDRYSNPVLDTAVDRFDDRDRDRFGDQLMYSQLDRYGNEEEAQPLDVRPERDEDRFKDRSVDRDWYNDQIPAPDIIEDRYVDQSVDRCGDTYEDRFGDVTEDRYEERNVNDFVNVPLESRDRREDMASGIMHDRYGHEDDGRCDDQGLDVAEIRYRDRNSIAYDDIASDVSEDVLKDRESDRYEDEVAGVLKDRYENRDTGSEDQGLESPKDIYEDRDRGRYEDHSLESPKDIYEDRDSDRYEDQSLVSPLDVYEDRDRGRYEDQSLESPKDIYEDRDRGTYEDQRLESSKDVYEDRDRGRYRYKARDVQKNRYEDRYPNEVQTARNLDTFEDHGSDMIDDRDADKYDNQTANVIEGRYEDRNRDACEDQSPDVREHRDRSRNRYEDQPEDIIQDRYGTTERAESQNDEYIDHPRDVPLDRYQDSERFKDQPSGGNTNRGRNRYREDRDGVQRYKGGDRYEDQPGSMPLDKYEDADRQGQRYRDRSGERPITSSRDHYESRRQSRYENKASSKSKERAEYSGSDVPTDRSKGRNKHRGSFISESSRNRDGDHREYQDDTSARGYKKEKQTGRKSRYRRRSDDIGMSEHYAQSRKQENRDSIKRLPGVVGQKGTPYRKPEIYYERSHKSNKSDRFEDNSEDELMLSEVSSQDSYGGQITRMRTRTRETKIPGIADEDVSDINSSDDYDKDYVALRGVLKQVMGYEMSEPYTISQSMDTYCNRDSQNFNRKRQKDHSKTNDTKRKKGRISNYMEEKRKDSDTNKFTYSSTSTVTQMPTHTNTAYGVPQQPVTPQSGGQYWQGNSLVQGQQQQVSGESYSQHATFNQPQPMVRGPYNYPASQMQNYNQAQPFNQPMMTRYPRPIMLGPHNQVQQPIPVRPFNQAQNVNANTWRPYHQNPPPQHQYTSRPFNQPVNQPGGAPYSQAHTPTSQTTLVSKPAENLQQTKRTNLLNVTEQKENPSVKERLRHRMDLRSKLQGIIQKEKDLLQRSQHLNYILQDLEFQNETVSGEKYQTISQLKEDVRLQLSQISNDLGKKQTEYLDISKQLETDNHDDSSRNADPDVSAEKDVMADLYDIFYCSLCEHFSDDVSAAEAHFKTDSHIRNYKSYLEAACQEELKKRREQAEQQNAEARRSQLNADLAAQANTNMKYPGRRVVTSTAKGGIKLTLLRKGKNAGYSKGDHHHSESTVSSTTAVDHSKSESSSANDANKFFSKLSEDEDGKWLFKNA